MLHGGKFGQLYCADETSFSVVPAIAATHALRHRQFLPTWDPQSKRHTDEKRGTPGRGADQRVRGREAAGFTVEGLLRPSGTLNTLPECDEIIHGAFGSRTNVTLNTTVASGGTVGGATLTSAGTLAVNDFVLITCPDGKRRARRLLTVVGAAVTWAPDLPSGQAPANGAAVKGCITYKLTTALIRSLVFWHYLPKVDGSSGLNRQLSGSMVESLGLTFDANEEPRFRAGGPAKTVADAPAHPGAFTTVGLQPPSGTVGEIVIGNSGAYVHNFKFRRLMIDLTNGIFVRNDSYGFQSAEEAFRAGSRDIAVGLDAYLESDQKATIYDLAVAGTNVGVFKQTGFTEGNIVAVDMPVVEFKVPDSDDPDGPVNWPYKGMALEASSGGNSELYLALL